MESTPRCTNNLRSKEVPQEPNPHLVKRWALDITRGAYRPSGGDLPIARSPMQITPESRHQIAVAAFTKRRDLIETLIKSVEEHGFARRVLASRLTGNVLWTAEEHVHSTRSTRLIASYVLAKRDGCWGFLNRFEKAGPWHVSCPVDLLDQVPAVNPAWRARVMARASKQPRAAQLPRLRTSRLPEAA